MRTETSPPGEELAEAAQLVERAGVEEHAPLDEALQVLRQLLGRDLDLLGGDAGAQGALGLEAARGVDVEPLRVEDPQHRGRRQRLHREAADESARGGEREHRVGRRLEGPAVVDVDGGSRIARGWIRSGARSRSA
jgi:hypothetical protein